VEIQIDPHTLAQAQRRGVSAQEIEDVLRTGRPTAVKHRRLGKYKVFSFDADWNGKHYREKRIEVVYVVGEYAIITVTVYAFYGAWSEAP
jgi:hypothetical protein